MIAIFGSLSYQELFLLFVVGLLLYGRNLPEAGRSLGKIVAQLKRSWFDFKDQLDREGEIKDVKKMFQDTAREVKNVTKVPRAIGNPGQALRDFTRETISQDAITHDKMSMPVPDEQSAESAREETVDDEPRRDPGRSEEKSR